MSVRPPRVPRALLARALSDDESGPAILGDLHETFLEAAIRAGPWRARLWYTREALSLAATTSARRALRPTEGTAGPGTRNARQMNQPPGLRGLIHDTRYAFRAVRRDGSFFIFATLIIGIGVGASTSVYSVMSPLMFAPLPFEDPGQLVWVENTGGGASLSSVTHRSGNLRDFRELSRSFEGLSGYNAFFDQSSYNLVGDGQVEKMLGVDVAHDFLDVLGVMPLYGRNFTLEEGTWGGPEAIILTHGFWVRRFAADPGLVGTSITLNGVPRQVVGVLPPHFDFSSVFTPLVDIDFLHTWPVGEETDRWGNSLFLIGRLRTGVAAEAAQAELDAIVLGLEEADPDRWGLGAAVSPLQTQIAGPFRSAMLLLAAAAGTIMLLVCVNLSNMLLARSPKRKREIAVRKTLGATRGRLIRQLIIESVFLSMSGAIAGVLIAVATTRFVSGTSGISIPMLDSVGVDGPALLFTVILALTAGVLVGVIPALQVSEGGEAEAMKSAHGASRSGRGTSRLRETLVVSQVTLACVLLVFGGLFLRSFRQVLDVELGFSPEGAMAWQLGPSRSFETPEEEIAFFGQLVQTVRAVPGVEAVGMIDALPLGKNRNWGLQVLGAEYEHEERVGVFPHMIDAGYLGTMGIELVAGRGLRVDDTRGTEQVVLINASAAEELFPRGDALGQSLLAFGDDPEWLIVGVVADVKHVTLEMGSGLQVYFPMSQMPAFTTMDLVVRSRVAPEALAVPVSAALQRLDPGMSTNEYWTLDSTVDRAVSSRRFTLLLLGAFAAVSLLLAALGIYAVLSYSVTERMPEIGIRMALGASGAEMRWRVVGRTLFLASVGIVVGVGISILGSSLIASLLFGVAPTDPATFLWTILVLLGAAGLSGLGPALRASRTDLLTVLRS